MLPRSILPIFIKLDFINTPQLYFSLFYINYTINVSETAVCHEVQMSFYIQYLSINIFSPCYVMTWE